MATGDATKEGKNLIRQTEQESQEAWRRGHPAPLVEYKVVNVASIAGYINNPDLEQREMLAAGWQIEHIASEPNGMVAIVWVRFPPLLDPPSE